ncbi:MAG: nuclear transport factor 2 family protein [Gemmatimonadota bacterium]
MRSFLVRRIGLVLLLSAILGRPAGGQAPSPASVAADSSSLAAVRAYFAAYNAHDIDATVGLLSPDFVWLSAQGDSIAVEARGLDAIRTGLVNYFKRVPSGRSDIEAATALGPWVMVRERARWVTTSGPQSQAAISVYEVKDGRLKSVCYYPVVHE